MSFSYFSPKNKKRERPPRLSGDFIKTVQAALMAELRQVLKNLAGFHFTLPADFPSESPCLTLLSEAVNRQLRAILQLDIENALHLYGAERFIF